MTTNPRQASPASVLRELQVRGPVTPQDLAEAFCPGGAQADGRTREGRVWRDTLISVYEAFSDLEHAGQIVRVRTRGPILLMTPSDATALLEETRSALDFAAERVLDPAEV